MDQTPSAFICPVHPNIRRLGPGICPKCGAELAERAMQSSFFRFIGNQAHIVITLVLMLAVMVAGWWLVR